MPSISGLLAMDLAVLHVALVDEGLEVGAVLDAVGRVDADHLYLAGHAHQPRRTGRSR